MNWESLFGILLTYLFYGTGTPPTETETSQDAREFFDVRNELVFADLFWELEEHMAIWF